MFLWLKLALGARKRAVGFSSQRVKVIVGIWGQGSSRKPGDELRLCLAVWGPEAGCKEGVRGESFVHHQLLELTQTYAH